MLEAIAPRLVEAVTALGDKEALASLCQNVPQMGGPLGGLFTKPGVEGLTSLLGNESRLSAALNAILKAAEFVGRNPPSALIAKVVSSPYRPLQFTL